MCGAYPIPDRVSQVSTLVIGVIFVIIFKENRSFLFTRSYKYFSKVCHLERKMTGDWSSLELKTLLWMENPCLMTDLWQLYLLVGLRSSKLRSRDETPSTYSSMRKTWTQPVLGDWNQTGETLRLSFASGGKCGLRFF